MFIYPITTKYTELSISVRKAVSRARAPVNEREFDIPRSGKGVEQSPPRTWICLKGLSHATTINRERSTLAATGFSGLLLLAMKGSENTSKTKGYSSPSPAVLGNWSRCEDPSASNVEDQRECATFQRCPQLQLARKRISILYAFLQCLCAILVMPRRHNSKALEALPLCIKAYQIF
jgi:hypothetical protein